MLRCFDFTKALISQKKSSHQHTTQIVLLLQSRVRVGVRRKLCEVNKQAMSPSINRIIILSTLHCHLTYSQHLLYNQQQHLYSMFAIRAYANSLQMCHVQYLLSLLLLFFILPYWHIYFMVTIDTDVQHMIRFRKYHTRHSNNCLCLCLQSISSPVFISY